MVQHSLIKKYFHGCKTCRDCCSGMFSIGLVTISDFKNIVKLFPTAFDFENKRLIYFYSLTPFIGCHYFRNNECSIYDVMDRPDTCLNYPFGINRNVISADFKGCRNLNDVESDFPIIFDNGQINPRLMNEFFTEFQYVSNLKNANNVLLEFVELVFESNTLLPFPKFKTTDGQLLNIREIESNKHMMILDIEKINKIIRKMNNPIYDSFVQGHLLSLENLSIFGKRLLEQI